MSNNIMSQNDLLLTTIMKFYDNHDNLQIMLPIVNGESKVSLRIIDWFTTNYAKKKDTSYIVNKTNFKVYDSYKLKLKSYKKSRFDPFCRHERIYIPVICKNINGESDKKISIETTVGQLNFFKWAIENNIIKYIEDNFQEIEIDMNNNNSLSKSKKHLLSNTRKKREELSLSSGKYLKKENVSITFTFNN